MYRKPSLSTMHHKQSLITMYRQIFWYTILSTINHESSLTFCSHNQSKNAISFQQLSAKITGLDAIFLQMLKLVSPAVDPILTSIWNWSFAISTFPTYWKKDLKNPLFKTPIPFSISDTRLIAILQEQSKLVEREASNQLFDFLETNELLEPWQACYPRGYST